MGFTAPRFTKYQMHEIRWFDKSLKLRDGIRLTSRIWLPHGNGPWPALLMRQPYGKEIASTITYSHPEWWASKGYMVIIQDVRGMGSSEAVSYTHLTLPTIYSV